MSKTLFDQLDLNQDGALDRRELHRAAKRLRWHWREAPLFALLDLFAIKKPISVNQFDLFIRQISNDPLGVYGDVLWNVSSFYHNIEPLDSQIIHEKIEPDQRAKRNSDSIQLKQAIGPESFNIYNQMLQDLDIVTLSRDETALLIVDPQRAFTQGVWMRSIGPGAEQDVKPIRYAFGQCAKNLIQTYGKMAIMFTRCPFPPDSYPWDERLNKILDKRQLYFIKPGNSVLFPPSNGYKEWVERCISNGRNTLVMGGCTLNSCIRVSSIETQRWFKHQKLQVVVDLSLCGARVRNYKPSRLFDGLSAAESAVKQMMAAGVTVVRNVRWA